MTQTLNQTLIAFEEAREQPPETPDLVLAVGILLGGGFPRCAGAVAYLAEATHKKNMAWPWGGVPQ
jgi:hypothetical protein